MSTEGILGVMDWTVSTQVLIASMTLSWLLRIVFRNSYCRSCVGLLAIFLPPLGFVLFGFVLFGFVLFGFVLFGFVARGRRGPLACPCLTCRGSPSACSRHCRAAAGRWPSAPRPRTS